MREENSNRPVIESLEGRQLFSVQQLGDPVPVGLPSGTESYIFSNMVTAGEKLYFATYEDFHLPKTPRRLSFWRTDGVHRPTAFQTFADSQHAVASLFTAGQTIMAVIHNGQFLPQNPNSVQQLWAMGDNGKLAKIADGLHSVSVLFQTSTLTYFSAAGPRSTYQLWVTDGTSAGTRLLNTTKPTGFSQDDAYKHPVEFQGQVYFISITGQIELLRTDGTKRGTVRITKLGNKVTDPPWSFVDLCVIGKKLCFTAFQDINHRQLWATDGTPAGTTLLASIAALFLVNAGKSFYFWSGGPSLYQSDGTRHGTHRVLTVSPGHYVDYYFPAAAQGKFYFKAWTLAPGTYDDHWYVSDGTAAGTIPTEWPYDHVRSVSVIDDHVYVINDEPYLVRGDSGQYLHIANLPTETFASNLTKLGDRIFFSLYPHQADEPTQGLWYYQP